MRKVRSRDGENDIVESTLERRVRLG